MCLQIRHVKFVNNKSVNLYFWQKKHNKNVILHFHKKKIIFIFLPKHNTQFCLFFYECKLRFSFWRLLTVSDPLLTFKHTALFGTKLCLSKQNVPHAGGTTKHQIRHPWLRPLFCLWKHSVLYYQQQTPITCFSPVNIGSNLSIN